MPDIPGISPFGKRSGRSAGVLTGLRIGLASALLLLTGLALACGGHFGADAADKTASFPLVLNAETLPDNAGTVYSVRLSKEQQTSLVAIPALSKDLAYPESFQSDLKPLFLINAGFFDPGNKKTISYVTLPDGTSVSPQDNEGLTGNEALAPYLPKIFNRSEFRFYQCGGGASRYAFTPHQTAVPAGCSLLAALGGGPMLLPGDTAYEEAFVDFEGGKPGSGKRTRDPIGVDRKNARSAVGMTKTGDLLFVMVAQHPENPGKSGMSLPELAAWMKSQGVEQAMALDGGSSSAIVLNGQAIYGKVSPSGETVKRRVKSILMIATP